MPTDRRRTRPDLGAVAVSGLATCAWYAVPDVVPGRGRRALVKTAVLLTGITLGVAVTREGRQARSGLRAAQRDDPASRHDADAPAGVPDEATDVPADDATAVPPSVAVAVLGTGLVLTGVLTVAGERWLYRRAEAMRARGVRAPHTRVGLVMGGVAAALAALDPPLAQSPAAPAR
ncbi:hypothetical protein [Isoptericola haloaureus]|uniref:Peptidase S9 n=1 Tax=Isoptericola haloaureus TaxID=1542902 RepID=A0ABU7ZA24_9MICO